MSPSRHFSSAFVGPDYSLRISVNTVHILNEENVHGWGGAMTRNAFAAATMTRTAIAALLLVCAATGCGASGGDAPEPIAYGERPAPAAPGPTPAPTAPGRLVVSADACQSDADCVPAGCCHAAACVARANAPSCGDAMCTQDCRFGTLDCGGACLCHEGHCAARLSEPPAMAQDQEPSGS